MADWWWRIRSLFYNTCSIGKEFLCVREMMGNLKAIKVVLKSYGNAFRMRGGVNNGGFCSPSYVSKEAHQGHAFVTWTTRRQSELLTPSFKFVRLLPLDTRGNDDAKISILLISCEMWPGGERRAKGQIISRSISWRSNCSRKKMSTFNSRSLHSASDRFSVSG